MLPLIITLIVTILIFMGVIWCCRRFKFNLIPKDLQLDPPNKPAYKNEDDSMKENR